MTIEEELVQILIEKGYYISFAESITGGMCASKLVNVPDASKVLKESFVTYSNEAKVKYLGVSPEKIDTYGVVSEDVAYEMALGVANNTGAQVGVGVTGMAGPKTDGTVPVGTVCFGISINGYVQTSTICFKEIGRNNVRREACDYLFEELVRMLK